MEKIEIKKKQFKRRSRIWPEIGRKMVQKVEFIQLFNLKKKDRHPSHKSALVLAGIKKLILITRAQASSFTQFMTMQITKSIEICWNKLIVQWIP